MVVVVGTLKVLKDCVSLNSVDRFVIDSFLIQNPSFLIASTSAIRLPNSGNRIVMVVMVGI